MLGAVNKCAKHAIYSIDICILHDATSRCELLIIFGTDEKEEADACVESHDNIGSRDFQQSALVQCDLPNDSKGINNGENCDEVPAASGAEREEHVAETKQGQAMSEKDGDEGCKGIASQGISAGNR